MRVRDIAVETGPDPRQPVRLSATLEVDTDWLHWDPPFRLWYDLPEAAADWVDPTNADPYLAAFLLPAMRLGEPLQLEGEMSSRLFDALAPLQAIYATWDPEYKVVPVDVRRRVLTLSPASDHKALFFSHGIDSTYSLVKNLRDHADDPDSLTHLVIVEGFDIYLWERERFPPLLARVRDVAAGTGMVAWPVTTNLREFSDRIVDWRTRYYGAALASVAMASSRFFSSARISAWGTPADLSPEGGHPLTDPLWSSEYLTFIHDGLEAGRIDKARAIAAYPWLIAGLRVCTTGELTSEYNCGRCEKCIRTQLELHVVDALRLCETLPQAIDLAAVQNLPLGNDRYHPTYWEIWRHLSQSGIERQLRVALAAAGLPAAPAARSGVPAAP